MRAIRRLVSLPFTVIVCIAALTSSLTFARALAVEERGRYRSDIEETSSVPEPLNVDAATLTGSEFKRFGPMDFAYLLNRLVHDEGR